MTLYTWRFLEKRCGEKLFLELTCEAKCMVVEFAESNRGASVASDLGSIYFAKCHSDYQIVLS